MKSKKKGETPKGEEKRESRTPGNAPEESDPTKRPQLGVGEYRGRSIGRSPKKPSRIFTADADALNAGKATGATTVTTTIRAMKTAS